MPQLSDKFLNVLQQQLKSFEAEVSIRQLVVYVAKSKDQEAPTLEAVGYWPHISKTLPPIEKDPELRAPSQKRRWYPLQEGKILLGVLRVEGSTDAGWPDDLDERLQAVASSLAICLSLDLENTKLVDELNQQRENIGLMVHQLRNPLTALRTYAQLLLRRLGPESDFRNLVEGLLSEQAQLNSYISALNQITQPRLSSEGSRTGPLLLPPVLSNSSKENLRALLKPLIDRASATAALQGRKWFGPKNWPYWTSQSFLLEQGSIAEIVANLLENAFRYSKSSSAIGLLLKEQGVCVWDGGVPIALDEREKIFKKGFRGGGSQEISGSGLGLHLARELARRFGGDLILLECPISADQSLPKEGNAFFLELPKKLRQVEEA